MTTAGTISVGVDIDATGLGARLHNAISAQLAPVMAQLRTQTQGTGNDFGDLAHRAELSSARQVVALRRVVEQLHDVRNAALQAHTALNSLHGPGGNSVGPLGTGGNLTINRNTYNYRNYSVTNNYYNNSTTTIHNNGGGGGGPGGGGNNNHGGGSGGGSRLTSPLTLGAVGLGANLLPAATLAATNLLGAVQQLSQAGLALPGIFAGGIASVGTAVIGFQGMGDAIKAINKGMEEGASKGDLKKMADALKGLNGNAKEVALTVATDVLPAFKKIQQDVVQQNMFDGIAASITSLKDKAMPTFERGLGGMAKAWNDTLKKGMSALGDDQNLSLLDRIFGNSAEGQKRANAAIAPLTHAMAQLAATGSDFLPRLGDAVAKVMTRFDNFISTNAANGNLWRWIDEGLNGMRALGNSVLNIGKVFAGITKAAGGLTGSLSGDGGFLGGMEKLTGQWAEFINSAEGQEKLGNFFKEAKERLGEWIPILGDVAKVIGDVFKGLQQWGDVLLPILSKVTSALSSMPGLVTAAVTAFAGFKTLGWLAGLFGLGGGAGAGAGAGGLLGGLLKGPLGVGLAGAGLFTGGVMSSAGPDGPGWGSGLSTIGGGALLGAAIGSVVPVIGTGLGAAIGAGAGAITVGVQALVASMGNVDKPLNDLTDSIRAAAAENWKNIKAQTGLQDDPNPGINPGQDFNGPRPADAIPVIGKDGLPILPDPNKPNDLARLGLGLIDNPLARTPMPEGQPQPPGFPVDKDGRPLVRTDNTGRPEPGGAPDFTGGFAPIPTPSNPWPVTVVNDPLSGINPPALPGNTLAPKDLGSLLSDTPPPTLYPNPAGPGPAYQATPPTPPVVQGPGLPNNWPGGGGPQAPLAPVKGQVDDLAKALTDLPPAKIDVETDQLKTASTGLTDMRKQMDDISGNKMQLNADPAPAKTAIDQLIQSYQGRQITLNVNTPGGAPVGPPQTRAFGGPIFGGTPGVDSVPILAMPGEHMLTTADVNAMGGHAGVYAFRQSLHTGLRRFATGGAVDGSVFSDPLTPPNDNSVIGLLTQIRDALVGRGSSALATTADNTTQMAQALGPKAKPFGGDVGKGALAGAIKALGGDPNLMDWGGYSGDGQLLVPKAGFNAAGLSAGVPPGVAAALQAFARSGNTADLGGGLSVTDPVVRAIVTARNKKTGLSDDQIAGLVGQVLGGGGFQGVLDPTNTPLVNALTAYQNKANRPVRGSAPVAAGTGVGLTPLGGFDAALLSQVPAGQYSQTGAADLTKGLADCSSSVEDLVNLMDGSSTAGRSLSTANAAQWFPEHGFLPGTMPGAFNVGFNSGHMQASLPDGTPFNWGSDAAAARGGVGGTGAFDPAFTQQFYRPVTGMPLGGGLGPGMGANPLGYSGGPVPVYIVDGPSASFGKQLAGQVAGQALDAMGQPLSDVAGSIITGIDQGTQLERDSTKNRPATPTSQLMKEGNPLSVAALAGYKVPDFSRKGWSGPVNTNAGPGFTAGGQMISDTSAIIQRSFADMEAANDARQQQLLAVLDAIKTQLSEQVLKPIIQSAVTAAMQAAGSGAAAGSMQVPGLAGGGGITGGVAGKDSVPALLMPGEHVFTTDDVARMGGQSGVYAFRRALYANGGAVRHFATGGGVNVNKTVGADFFGVGQVPIIGPLINLLINILLQVIGVNIEAADTLNEISSSFNQFRGDFKRFDATGRVTADTSALSDRSGSSKEKAVDERVRIFKEVLTGLIKFIIQKIIIPITQAVMQTLLSTASSAVSGAITGGIGAAGGGPAGAIVGNLVGGLINSAGGAAINIGGELISQLVGAATGPIVELITGGLMDMFGGLLSPILSGGIGGLVSMFLPFLAFDSGGVANGMGLLPKATVEPERVLSPRQTSLFEEMVRANFGVGGGDSSRHVTLNGGIHLHGSQATAEGVRNSLLTLMS